MNSMLSFYPQFWTCAFDFEGRTSRIDYWKIVLVNLILGWVLSQIAPSPVYIVFAVVVLLRLSRLRRRPTACSHLAIVTG